ncbi:MAG: hypothetical protein R3B48_22335 [Kofleriaceae bacterium]
MLKLSPAPLDLNAPARIGVLDRNRAVLARAARVVRAAAGLEPVAADSDPAGLRAQLAPNTHLLICDGADLELALEWSATRFAAARIITWSPGPMEPLLATARRHPQVCSILGWPSFLSMPRPWELALAVRFALRLTPGPMHLGELFSGVPVATKYRPRTSEDRDAVTSELGALAERAGATGRMIGRISETCHELLMNAMYDAPVNHYGEPRYAFDRRASVALDEHEIPTTRFATDGTLIALQVTDPFGRLTREHVLAGIGRGQAAAHTADADRIIDTSYGGAGLGLWKIYSSAAATIVDVVVGHSTNLIAVFDIDVGARESRTMPPSLHLFDHA